MIRGNVNAPMLIDTLAFVFLAITICFIVNIIDIRNNVGIVLLCGVLTTNVNITVSNATYLPWMDIYMAAALMNTAAVYLIVRRKHGYIPGVILITLSLALYQSYYQMAVVIMMAYYIQKTLQGTESIKSILLGILKSALSVLAAIALYGATIKIMTSVIGIELADAYNGISNVTDFSHASIPSLVLSAYLRVCKYIFFDSYPSLSMILSAVFASLLIVAAAIELFFILRKQKLDRKNVVLLFILIALISLGANSINIISKGLLHYLMVFPVFCIYTIVIVFMDHETNLYSVPAEAQKSARHTKAFRYILTALLSIMIWSNIVYANQVYLKKDFDYLHTSSIATRIIDRVEQLDGYRFNETPVAFIGTFSNSPLNIERTNLPNNGTGVNMGNNISITSSLQVRRYFLDLLNYPMNIVDDDAVSALFETEQVKAMPCFPDQDSCQIIDGTVIVKISNVL